VNLPRLDLTQTSKLREDVAALGLPLGGDYSGLGADDLEVDQVLQKTVLKVDEKGTEAAAVSGVTVRLSSNIGPELLQADRPFYLLIRDTKAGTPLFFAHINDPTVKTRQ
jgi:serpin B